MLAVSLRILLRRWIFVLVAIVVAAAAGIGVYKAIPPKYQTTSSILFYPPQTSPGVTGKLNPFLNLGGSMGVWANIVGIQAVSNDTANSLYSGGATATYTVVENLGENAGPILNVTVSDKSAAMTEHTLTAVDSKILQLGETLQTAQGVTDPNMLIRGTVITSDTKPKAVHKTQVQDAAIAAIVVFIIGLALILLAERLLERRRKANEARISAAVSSAPTPPRKRPRRARPSVLPKRNRPSVQGDDANLDGDLMDKLSGSPDSEVESDAPRRR
jgi:capsular polysaccharide biosynthesis protein